MSQGTLATLVIGFVLGMAGFVIWYSQTHPREIVGSGVVVVPVPGRAGTKAALRSRTVSINGVQFREVELPNGTWIDCAGDCVKAAGEAGDGFWQKQLDGKR